MAEYTITITAPEKVDLSIVSSDGQQLILSKGNPVQVTFDYEKDTLIFEGTTVKQIATLRTISDVFWMQLALTSKGFEITPNEPLEILKKLKLK
ncbi:MAG: hypothetical protein KAI53_05170 [Candidatus Aenigmarchaeota archaeon]|nr:hypothetical protein [Candidatus Aenigmarchaeota archaeon]